MTISYPAQPRHELGVMGVRGVIQSGNGKWFGMSASSTLREDRRRRREAALALRQHMSPRGPAPECFRVVRWGPHERRFTWWNHGLNYSRNLGMRIDLLAASDQLAGRLTTTWIDHLEREAERPSDHAALIADFERLARRAS